MSPNAPSPDRRLRFYFRILPTGSAALAAVAIALAALLDDSWAGLFITLGALALNGLILLGGLLTGRALLKPVLGAAWAMDEIGWRKLTFRFGLFFFAMAALNEIVWRTQSTDLWVNFKVFGIMGLTLVFALTQTPLLTRHKLPDEPPSE